MTKGEEKRYPHLKAIEGGCQMANVSFLGCGNMGFAIARALSEKTGHAITLHSPRSARAKAEEIGAKYAPTCEEALESADIVILAVKPQLLPSFYPLLSKYKEKKYISLAAGVPLEVLERKCSMSEICRFMPNLAAAKGESVTAVAFSGSASESFKAEAMEIAASFGDAFLLPEALFSPFIGVSGSAIAYILQMVHAMAMGGTYCGMSYTESARIAASTLRSAAAVLEDGEAPASLVSRVCSAGGTTIEGMKALAEGSFDAAVMDAVIKASNKSKALEERAKEN